jgi:hypothetical protein
MRLNKHASVLLAGVLLCGLPGGCKPSQTSSVSSSSNAASPSAVAVEPASASGSIACAALTAAKVSAALNATASLAESKNDTDGQSFCTYKFSKGGTARVQVVIGSAAESQYEALKSGVTDFTEVTGVGDKAFDSGQGFGAIKGDHFVAVIGSLPGDPDSQKKLAQAMLAAL